MVAATYNPTFLGIFSNRFFIVPCLNSLFKTRFSSAVSLAMPLINTRRFGPMVSSEQAVSLINKQNALVVDVRAQKDFKRVRIANSVNIPANEIQNRLGELSKDRTIIVVDNSGNMSAAASKLLRGVGFTKVYVLDRGLVGWMRDKLPLES